MASLSRPDDAVGPVPFKDITRVAVPVRPTPEEEYAGIISALPSYPKLNLRCYQGTWLLEYFLPGIIDVQTSLAPRHGDIILASPAKCGTTWLKALAFAIMARGVHPPASDGHPLLRLNPHDCVLFMEGAFGKGWGSVIDALPAPRIMSTHMQHTTLPSSIRDNPDCKVVYICREPKDMMVSVSHFVRILDPNFSFDEMFELACKGKYLTGPIWDHILGYWNASKTNPEKLLFLMYEDMLRDPTTNVRKLASFLGQPFSPGEEDAGLVSDIVGLCSFENLKSLEVNKTGEASSIFPNASYFRRGKTTDWKNHMTTEMAQRFDAIIRQKLHGSGLVFA